MERIAPRLVVQNLLSSTAGRHWFGDGRPTWFEGSNDDRPSMSRQKAKEQQLRDIKMLRRHCKRNRNGLRLADIIETCGEDHRCLSGACIECNRAVQRLFVESSESLFHKSAISVSAVSIVFRRA